MPAAFRECLSVAEVPRAGQNLFVHRSAAFCSRRKPPCGLVPARALREPSQACFI
jgi:hypothetical protein